MKKRKWYIILILVVLIVLLFITINLTYQNYKLGERNEREELLTEVMFVLAGDDAIEREEISEINVVKANTGIYPYFYSVIVEKKDGNRLVYSWSSKDKTGVSLGEKIGVN